jgi:hypothetical protein
MPEMRYWIQDALFFKSPSTDSEGVLNVHPAQSFLGDPQNWRHPARAILVCFCLLSTASCYKAATPIPEDLAKKILADDAKLEFCLREQSKSVELRSLLVLETVDLNGDKTPEYIVRTDVHNNCLCGNRSCSGWIYRATSMDTSCY